MTPSSQSRSDPLLVVVSIDTEEDNWVPARSNITVENIRTLPALQRRFARIGVRPTYFTSYQVASVEWAADLLRDIAGGGAAEIGAHLHPWNTPPIRESFAPRNSMMKNLPPELQYEKLVVLTDLLERTFGERPTSFRAGRYGMSSDGIAALTRCGYEVDSSVTPFLDWRRFDDGADYRDAPGAAYRPAVANMLRDCGGSSLIELPLSVGYTRTPFARWHRRHAALAKVHVGPYSLAGLAHRTRFLRKVQLSFETDRVRDMVTLTRRLIESGTRYLHLSWHSPSLVAGLSPFVRTARDRDAFLAAIDDYFDRLTAIASIEFATVTQAAQALLPAPAAVPAQRASSSEYRRSYLRTIPSML